MSDRQMWIQKIRFCLSIGLLYSLTMGFAWYCLQTPSLSHPVANATPVKQVATQPKKPSFKLISGIPTRIVVPDSGIDLPVDQGNYNSADGSWTLSDTNAQFAMITMVANNHSGNTFIYGHATDQVFGKLVSAPPQPNSTALVHTHSGHILSYRFQSARESTPNDTSIFNYTGPPILTLQTCTGAVSEWRTMYQYAFEKVVQ